MELGKLEMQADLLLRHVEMNTKKIRQQRLKDGTWDTRRLGATVRSILELQDIAEQINILGEHPEGMQLVRS